MISKFVYSPVAGQTRLVQGNSLDALLSKAADRLGSRVNGTWIPATELKVDGLLYRKHVDGTWRAVDVEE